MLHLVKKARDLPARAGSLPEQLAGQLLEISGESGSARLTLAVSLLRLAQLEAETSAWIQTSGGSLFPPDLEDAGVDLSALVVVRLPEETGHAPFRAAEMLLSSGAFGLVLLDLRKSRARTPTRLLGRLSRAAREHRSLVLFLTEKSDSAPSLGSLVGVRLEPRRVRVGPGTFILETRVHKNKPGLPLVEVIEHRRGPWGLR